MELYSVNCSYRHRYASGIVLFHYTLLLTFSVYGFLSELNEDDDDE